MSAVVNWYDTRKNIAALIRFDDLPSYESARVVEKPWEFDAEWDYYQASLPESQRWRGNR